MENQSVALESIENARKTHVLRRNLWQKYKNIDLASEHLEQTTSNILCGRLWKTQRKHRLCVGTYGKRKEHIGFVWEPIENARKTLVLRCNQWKT